MASQNPKDLTTRKAETDLTGAQYRIVTKGTTDPDSIRLSGVGTADYPIGILQDNPKQGEHGTLATSGVCKVKVKGAVTENAYCGSDANGFGAAVTTGVALGTFLNSGADGDVVRILVERIKLS